MSIQFILNTRGGSIMKEKQHLIVHLFIIFIFSAATFLYCKIPVLAATIQTDGDWSYYVNEDNKTVTITGYLGNDNEIVIPENIKGKIVTKISNLFKGYLYGDLTKEPTENKITNVTIPNTITEIFSSFCFCTSLKSISIPDSVTKISSSFNTCDSLENISLNNGLREIDDSFYFCNKMTSVVIPDSIETLSGFDGCSSLLNVTIPQNNIKIYGTSFSGSPWRKNLATNNGYAIVNGILLAYYGTSKELDIPGNVTEIAEGFQIVGNYGYSKYSIVSVNLPEGLKKIGDSVFYEYTNLETVNLPKSLQYVGKNAFQHTKWAYSIVGGYDQNDQFNYYGDYEYDVIIKNGIRCARITGYKGVDEHMNIPSEIHGLKVVSIGDQAFCYKTGIKKVTIPDTVIEIGEIAFMGCSNLEEINIPKTVTYIDGGFADKTKWLEVKTAEDPMVIVNNILIKGNTCTGNVTIPNGVSCIANGAFYGSTITSIVIPEGVTTIMGEAFRDCTNLETISFPKSLTKIEIASRYQYGSDYRYYDSFVLNGHSTFHGTKWLEQEKEKDPFVVVNGILINADGASGDIVIPSGVTTIADCVFSERRDDITSVTLPDGLKEIGPCAFNWNTNLKKLYMPDSVVSIGRDAFRKCENLSEVILSKNLKEIGEESLWCAYIDNLTQPLYINGILIAVPNAKGSYIIQDGTSIIWDSALQETNIQNITIPDSVTTINQQAFYGMKKLESLEIPSSVNMIRSHAFSQCSNLKTLIFRSENIIFDNTSMFEETNTNIYSIPGSLTWKSLIALGQPVFDIKILDDNNNPKDDDTAVEAPKDTDNDSIKPESTENTDNVIKRPEVTETIDDNNTNSQTPFTPITDTNTQVNIPPQSDTSETIQTTPEDNLSKGSIITLNGNQYKIISADVSSPKVAIEKSENTKSNSITIPATITLSNGTIADVITISANAFKNNKRLKKITIGKNIVTIERNAFYGCKNLKQIKIKSTRLKTVGKNAINGIYKKAEISCPKKMKKKYKKIFTKKTGKITSIKIK